MSLLSESQQFASTLSELLSNALAVPVNLATTELDHSHCMIQPSRAPRARPSVIPLAQDRKGDSAAPLGVNVRFKTTLGAESRSLSIVDSSIGLFLLARNPRPLFRIEFTRHEGSEGNRSDNRRHHRAAAHVHVHASSTDFGFVSSAFEARMGTTVDALHFPVGGRRFRPTVEDFVEFLEHERFLPPFTPQARALLSQGRENWQRHQLHSLIRENESYCRQYLDGLGK